MDDLLKDFLTEASETIESIENQLVRLEQDPGDAECSPVIFRLLHTIKGTAGFLSLDRMQTVAHHAETLMGLIRDGARPTPSAISLILAGADRLKWLVSQVDANGAEPEGNDREITDRLDDYVKHGEPGASNAIATGNADEPAKLGSISAPELNKTKRGRGKKTGGLIQSGYETIPLVQDAMKAATYDTPAAAPESSGQGTPDNNLVSGLPIPAIGVEARTTARSNLSSTETIRVPVSTLERIMELVSELVLTRNQLFELARQRDAQVFMSPLQRLSALTGDLQDSVMRTRMQPLARLFSTMPRIVRELSQELGKTIHLKTYGAETELDRHLIESIRDPLTHLLRNCADHGIELPEERGAAGKPEAGTITIRALHAAGQVVIEVTDDGRGFDRDRIREKVLAKGSITQAQLLALSDEALFKYILEPGFSTAHAVTTVSGRGVGMDVVRANIEAIGGTVSLFSTAGQGCKFVLRIPLTLAIEPAIIVKAGDERFALRQDAVVEAVGVGRDFERNVEVLQGALILNLRDTLLPVIDLNTVLLLEPLPMHNRLVIVIRAVGKTFGVIVDDVADIQEIVVKPLNPALNRAATFTGHTILGDGGVVLILDPEGLAVRLGQTKAEEAEAADPRAKGPGSSSELLIFRAGGGADKTLPLSVVSRIVRLRDEEMIETSSGTAFLHNGNLTPVIALNDRFSGDTRNLALLVTLNRRTFALLVDAVVDVQNSNADIQLGGGSPLFLGTGRVSGRTVDVVDAGELLRRAFPADASFRSRRTASVIVIEPNAGDRDVLVSNLKSMGYAATGVPSKDAIAGLLANGQTIDTVITDDNVISADEAAAWRRDGIDVVTFAGGTDRRVDGTESQYHKFDRVNIAKTLSRKKPVFSHAVSEYAA